MALYLSPMAPHLAPGWRHPNPHPDPDPNPNPNPNQAGGIFSCIDKLFEWFPHAVRTYPGAAFYGKADDDSLVDVPRLVEMLRPAILTMAMLTMAMLTVAILTRLVEMLRPAASLPNVYAGYVQYDSFIRDEWKHCGWGASPVPNPNPNPNPSPTPTPNPIQVRARWAPRTATPQPAPPAAPRALSPLWWAR